MTGGFPTLKFCEVGLSIMSGTPLVSSEVSINNVAITKHFSHHGGDFFNKYGIDKSTGTTGAGCD
jgi:hypothetical protein